MIIKCPKCGHLVDSNSHNCLICGSEINYIPKRGGVNNKALRIMYLIVLILIFAFTWSIWGAYLFPKRMPNVLLYSSYTGGPASFDFGNDRNFVLSNRNGKLISLKAIGILKIESPNVKTLRIPAYATVWESDALGMLESISIDKRNKFLRVSDDGYAMWHQYKPLHTAPDGIRIIWDEPEEELLFLSRKKNKDAILIPDGINSTRESMFKGWDWVTQIDFPSSMKRISSESFMGCGRLKGVIIPGSVNTIESGAFANCDSLRSVVIEEGESQLKIETGAFTTDNCYYYIKRATPPELGEREWGQSNAYSFPPKAAILVPYQYYNAYYSAWEQYASSIIPVIETDGKLQIVSFKNESLSDIDDGRTITSEGVSVTAPQTVWLDENFTVTYSFSGKVEDMSVFSSESFNIVMGPQKKVSSKVSGGSGSLLIEYEYILRPKQAGVYALPRLRALMDGEEIFTPEKYIEVMHEEYN